MSDKRQSAVLHMSDHRETPDFRPADTLNTYDSASAVAARPRTEDSGQLANTRIPLVRITFLEETPRSNAVSASRSRSRQRRAFAEIRSRCDYRTERLTHHAVALARPQWWATSLAAGLRFRSLLRFLTLMGLHRTLQKDH